MPVRLSSVDLPKKPGVYLFKTEQGRVLYVGKATKLNERIIKKEQKAAKMDRFQTHSSPAPPARFLELLNI